MKRLWRYVLNTAVLLACLSCLTGCFDRRELDTLGIVMGVAIDKGKDEGDTELTVQMANPSGGKSESKGKASKEDGGGSSGSSSAYINVSNAGKNMNFVVREMQNKMSRRIYVAHSEVLVMSEELARAGVRDCLDFFARAAEARMTPFVFISKGNAKDILEIEPEFEQLPSMELAKMLRDQKVTSHAPMTTEFDFVTNLMSKTTSAVAPIVSVINDGGIERLIVSGCAVFKQSKMVGEMDETDTRGLLFVQGKVKNGVFLADIQGETATIEIRDGQCKVTPILYTDGTAEFNVREEVTVGLGDQSGTYNLADPEHTQDLLNASQAVIKSEIQQAVDKSKELEADVFGFGEYIYRKYPEQWNQMKDKWDELYKNIKVNVTVVAKGDGSGRTVKPIAPDEAIQ
ncbi:spore germination protein KC [Sporobacter termitidis DSM 10068]|uniref:Spore germination protein KC n=1 Tax=Sporobacter termitidis DSM 10068 TaxID=1123282 RepID=A0A1M5X639_9FIRM|nr:Ger(x)C family spore germination protein [Sporobacter termitidis]SHH94673.1 spore germination protein KC [Sporobacter termitidis DSM 10068]